MTGRLAGRVAIVTGSGRGLGRAHALRLAAEGASVVVNDIGRQTAYGDGEDLTFAHGVVGEITSSGGKAIASSHDITDWEQAAQLVRLAIDTFGDLHVLVNNAGIAAITPLVDTTQDEWDRQLRVHLDGHAGTTRAALQYWRDQTEAGRLPKASIIHTASPAVFFAGPNMAHYDAAKAGIATFARVIALEGADWGVRSNALVPLAHTRMWEDHKVVMEGPLYDDGTFDRDNPSNVSPLVAWLAAENCPANRQTLYIYGDRLWVLDFPAIVHALETDGRWSLEELDRQLDGRLITSPTDPALALQAEVAPV
jgi:NAD(P)-dependent dehydrogenase (short-subunit alcohol dehydrogenase family)